MESDRDEKIEVEVEIDMVKKMRGITIDIGIDKKVVKEIRRSEIGMKKYRWKCRQRQRQIQIKRQRWRYDMMRWSQRQKQSEVERKVIRAIWMECDRDGVSD